MGVSLQVYRNRIGTFKSLAYSRTLKPRASLQNPIGVNLKLVLIAFLLSCSLPVYVQLNQESFRLQTTPLQQPSTTACDPSSDSSSCTPGQPLNLSQSNQHSKLSEPKLLSFLQPPWPPPSQGRPTFHSTIPTTDQPQYPPSCLPPICCSSTFTQPKACILQSTYLVPCNYPTPAQHLWPPPPQQPPSDCPSPPYLRQTRTCQLCQYLEAPSSWLTSVKRNALAKATFGNRSQQGRGIKCVVWNKGSSLLQNKHLEIESVIETHRPHILGLCEANLRNNADTSLVQHQDYQLHVARSISNPELGIARAVVYTHSSLVVKRRADLENDSLSSVWLEIGMPRQRKILVATFYREWQQLNQPDNASRSVQAQLERWCNFLTQWESALSEGREVIVMGDINLDFLKWTRSDLSPTDSTMRLKPLTDALFSRIFPHGVSQLVQEATRVWPGQPDSGLDHIYSNKPGKCSPIYLEFSGGSDHKLLKFTRYAKSITRSVKYVRKRSFKNFNSEEFVEAVKKISWFDLYMCQSPTQAAELLTRKLTYILDTMAPVRTIQVRTKYAAWLSDQTKAMLKSRDASQAKAARTRDPDDWREYKNLRNTATARMRTEKKSWEKQKLDKAQHSSSTLWQNVKSWLSWGDSGPPSKLFHNGMIINKPARLATIMNEFFINKVRQLRELIPAAASDPLTKLREVLQDRQCTFTMRAVSPDEVAEIVAGLKNTKSTGMDFIDTWVVKLVANEILPALTHIVNISISQAEFPMPWKISKVVPLLKKGDPLQTKNYRPVALLPIFSKILERAVFLQMVKYLESNHLLNPNHHGCRQGHNTATALLQMYDQWLEEVENGMMVGVMLVDLSAAFDMVDHDILIKKLELYGLDNQSLSWMKSYLSSRSQVVMVDGCLSPPLSITCGVPQGSILGPLLYILFTNDIPDLVHDHPVSFLSPSPHCADCGSTVCYVDDSTYSHGEADPAVLSHKLTQQYDKISDYMAANKLVINGDKTHLVVMGTKKTAAKRQEVFVQADGHTIQPSRTEKLLGGVISEDLKWREHLLSSDQSLVTQLTSRINGLVKVASRAPMATRLMVANGIFMSKLCYLIQLWGGCEKYLVKSLQILQNRAARAVTGKSWWTPIRRLLHECRWLSVRQLIFYQTALQTHKILIDGNPVYFKQRMSTNHPYRTRQAAGGSIWRGEEEQPGTSFTSRGAQVYNSLPNYVRNCRTLPTFKYKLRQWVATNIPID